MADTFETYITNERNRIRAEREKIIASRAELDGKLSALDNEMRAITAYEEVKLGRGAPKATRTVTGTGRRTGQRDAVLATVKGKPEGITAADVLTALNPSDDADKTSIRNALAALKRNGHVTLKDGKYSTK